MYSGISDFKKCYQPRTNTVRDEKSDLVTDAHSILARWWNHFSQLFSVNGVSDVRQTEIHTAEPLVLEQSAFEVEMDIEKLKSHKSPGIDRIPAELIKAGGEQISLRSINLSILFRKRKHCMRSGRSRSMYVFIRRAIQLFVVIIEAYHFCQSRTELYPTSCCQG